MRGVQGATRNQIKRLREEKGLRRVQMAAEFNVDQSTVYRWETGAPPLELVPAIATYLGVTPAEVMGWEEAAA